MATSDFRELGITGLKKSGGIILEEYLPELRGDRWQRVMAKMMNDAIVNATFLAMRLSLRQVTTEFKPADDTPAAADVAEFFKGCLADMSSSWADTQTEILSMLPQGWAYEETVYKRRMGDNVDPSKRSKFNDGKIGWRKWSIRAQNSLERWEFDDKGGLMGMWQYQDNGGAVLIPITKALLFRTTADKGNPEGESLLRSAYRAWYMKSNTENIEAIGIERNLGGVPVIYADAQIMGDGATSGQQAFFEQLKEIVVNLRVDEQAGVILPSAYDEKGNRLYELILLSSTGSVSQDTGAIISRYTMEIALTLLADFILLGHEKVGSYSLSATKADMFQIALEAWLQSIADVINTHGIPRLGRLNGIPQELLPTLCFGKVGKVELADLVLWIKEFSAAGGQLFPDMELENHLRRLVDLPQMDEETYNQREEERKAQEEADRQARARQPQGNQQQDAQMSAAHAALLEAAQRIVVRGA